MASRGLGQTVQTPIPADQRQYYLLPYSTSVLHGRGRKGAKKTRSLHGRKRSEHKALDPWHHKGQAKGQ